MAQAKRLHYIPESQPDEAEKLAEVEKLSARQTAVLMKAIQGKPNKIIARELDIAEGTVKAHLSMAYRTLGVKNRTEAVFASAKLGLTPGLPDED